jgi:hypothetical protein
VPLIIASVIKRGLFQNPESLSLPPPFLPLSLRSSPSALFLLRCLPQSSTVDSPSPPMAASHLHMFQQSTVDESKILKLVENQFLPDRVVLQWWPAAGEDILTPNIKEIVVFSSFQRGFGLPTCDFLHGLLQH